MGGGGGCEQRIEVVVKMAKKSRDSRSGREGSNRLDVNWLL